MISRSTVIGALVVVELAILGAAARALGGHSGTTSFATGWSHHHSSAPKLATLDKTFATGAAPHVVIDVDTAHVFVQAGASSSVHVAGTMTTWGRVSGVAPSLTAVQTGDGVQVNAESGLARVHGRLEREVRLTVPPGASIEIERAGAVETAGLRGKIVARLDQGPVRIVGQRGGEVDVTTDSGDVSLLDVQAASIAAHTDDGALKLSTAGADHIDAHTGSGAITAVGLRAVDGALASDDGRIDVAFAPESDAAVKLHTDDGRITGVGAPAAEDSADSRSLQLGSGRGRFSVTTGSGSIAVSQGANG